MPTGDDHRPERSRDAGSIRFRSIASYAETCGGIWNLEYQQLRAARQEGWCHYACDGEALVYEELYPAATGLRGGVGDGLFAALLTDPCGAAGRWQGRNAPTSAVACADSRVETDVLMPAAARNVAVVMPLAFVHDRFERLSGGSGPPISQGDRLFHDITPEARQQLEACWLALLRRPPAAETLGLRVVESLVRALRPVPADRHGVPRKAARALFRRAMERCEAEVLNRSVGELALELGVSLRLLEMAFHACMGMSPARYLRRLRLNRARERLLRLDPDGGSVTEVALDLGFTELGRFSVEYRRLFGESPSETLRNRRPGGAPRLPVPA